MLRRCCLCTRQFELSAASCQPVASTSTHIFRSPSSSSSRKSRNNARRSFNSKALELPAYEAENLFEKQPSSTASLWKGKARAIEPPPAATRAARRTEETSRISSKPAASSSHAESSSTAGRDILHRQPIDSHTTIADSSLDETIRDGSASKALLVLLETSITAASAGTTLTEVLKRDLRRIQIAFPERLREDDPSIRYILRIQGDDSTDGDIALLSRLTVLCMRVMQEQGIYGDKLNKRARQLLRTAVATSTPQGNLLVKELLASTMELFHTRRRWEAVEQLGQLSLEMFQNWHPPILEFYLQAIIPLDRDNLAPPSTLIPPLLSLTTYNLLIKAHLRNRNLAEARYIFRHMQANDMKPARSTYQAILEGYRTLGANHNLYRALTGTVKQLGLELDTKLVNMLIECCIGMGDLAGAHDLLQAFGRPGQRTGKRELLLTAESPPPTSSLATSSSPTTSGMTVIPASEQAIIPNTSPALIPNTETFSLLVKGYAQIGDLERALDLYTEMLDEGFQPSPILTGAIRRAYLSAGRSQQHSSVIAEVERLHQFPDAIQMDMAKTDKEISQAYHSQLQDLLRTRGLAGLREVIDKMTEEGLRVRDQAISWIVAFLSKHVGAEKLARIATKLREAHGSSTALSDFNILTNAFTDREHRLRQSTQSPISSSSTPLLFPSFHDSSRQNPLAYLSLVRSLQESGIGPDAYTCAIFMQQFADNRGSPRILWDYFRWQILDRGLRPNGYHVAALMTAYCKAGDLYGARRIMERGESLGVTPNVQHYTILIQASKDKQPVVEALLGQMQEREIQLDFPVYAALASMAAKHGLLKQVQAIQQRAKRQLRNMTWPNPVMETILFRCRNIRREWSLAQIMLKEASEAGLIPDRVLLRVASRVLASHRSNRNTLQAQGGDIGKLEEAIELGQSNLTRMREVMRQTKEREQQEGAGNVSSSEISETLDCIIRNRQRTSSLA